MTRCLMRAMSVAALATFQIMGEPPGASVQRKIAVPPALRSAPFDVDRFLTVPPGFNVALLALVPDPRFLAIAPGGQVLVSRPEWGMVSIIGADGSFTNWVSGLRQPHGLAFDTVAGTTWLYIAEEYRVTRFQWTGNEQRATSGQVVVDNLPPGGHNLKNIAIGPDHSLYVSIGSSCNICDDYQSEPNRAAIYRYLPGAAQGQLFARGLRNAEGVAFVPGTDSLWAAVNNRDEILPPSGDNRGQLVRSYVDDHPPELFTAVRAGGNYGWPFCNANPDTAAGTDLAPFDNDFEMNPTGAVDCSRMDRVTKSMQAHSAPLGLTFVNGTNFAAPWQPGAVIAFHGSWDRSVPTGYKVVYFPFIGGAPRAQTDLVTGFLGWGRPAGVAVAADGALLISDDGAGAIYRLTWAPSAVSAASGYPLIAPDSYASVYAALGPGTVALTLTDSTGASFGITPVWASETQANFIVPAKAAPGTARLTARVGDKTLDLGQPEIRSVAPGLFAVQPAGDELQLFATGVRGAANMRVTVNGVDAPVLGVDSSAAGVDVIRVSAAGTGVVQVVVGDAISNAVTLR